MIGLGLVLALVLFAASLCHGSHIDEAVPVDNDEAQPLLGELWRDIEGQVGDVVYAEQSGDQAMADGLARNLSMIPHAVNRAVNAARFIDRAYGEVVSDE